MPFFTRGWRRLGVRAKLLLLVLVPLVLLTSTVLSLASLWTSQYSYDLLLRKVTTDLSVAEDAVARLQHEDLEALAAFAGSERLQRTLVAPRKRSNQMAWQLSEFAQKHRLNSLRFLPENDRLQTRLNSPLYQQAMDSRDGQASILRVDNSDLAKVNAHIAKQMILPLVPTPRAKVINRDIEDRALLIQLVQPVEDADGALLGLLEGWILLNRNFHLVDTVRDLVYPNGSLLAGSLGTVTVFLEDVRISTNVPSDNTPRALGTRVSEEVRRAVLDEGRRWIARAFVVNDWYVSAYAPITDVFGRRVGILYAGYLEAPYQRSHLSALSWLAVLLLVGACCAGIVAVAGARTIIRPVEQMVRVARAITQGKVARVGSVSSADELAELARHFDAMILQLADKQASVELSAELLERKVAQRTAELELRNEALQHNIALLRRARRQLALAEKLAALGELTAGVAHEINNPTAVILGNMDVLTCELGRDATRVAPEIDLILAQVERIREIVSRLLTYSRPRVYGGGLARICVNEAIQSTLPLVRHELLRRKVDVTLHLRATRHVEIPLQELQQVLVNLLINAAQATGCDGKITLSSDDDPWPGVLVRVCDNGPGMSESVQLRVFEPFFTREKSAGIGLGLSVSYNLLRRFGGQLSVQSQLGEGSTFSIRLREQARLLEEEEDWLDLPEDP